MGFDPLFLALCSPLIIVACVRIVIELHNAIEKIYMFIDKKIRERSEVFRCFEDLPDDLQLCVLDYLDVKELGAMTCTSKTMNAACKQNRYWDKHLTHLLTECYDGSFQYVRDKTRIEKREVLPIPFSERSSPLEHSSLVSWYADWGDFFHRYPMKVLMSFNAILAMRREDTVPDWLRRHGTSRGTYMEAGRAIYRIWRFEEEFAKIMGQCIDCRDMAKDCRCWRQHDCNKWKRRSRPGATKRSIEAMPSIRLFRDDVGKDGSANDGGLLARMFARSKIESTS